MNEPATDTSTASGKPRRGWWFLAKLVLILRLLVVGTLWFWVRSDGDLRAARERIVAAGFPTTGAEMGRKRSDEVQIKSLQRLDALFADKTGLNVYYGQMSGFATPGVPLPKTLTTYLAALPPTAVAEALMLIDRVGEEAVALDEAFTLATRTTLNYRVIQLVGYLALVAPAEELPDHLWRLVRIARSCIPQSENSLGVKQQTLSRLMQVLLYRRGDLDAQRLGRFAGLLLELTAHPGHDLALAQTGSLVIQLDFFIDPELRLKQSGHWMAEPFSWPVVSGLIYRAGRAPFLDNELEWSSFLRSHQDDLRVIVNEARRRMPSSRSWPELFNPTLHLEGLLSQTPPERNYWCEGLAKIRLRAELVAAVLRDEPWPVDWFDPTGAKLRPITLDGKVTGAYSVGPDGIDDGGTSNKDVRWALFGPIDPPKP